MAAVFHEDPDVFGKSLPKSSWKRSGSSVSCRWFLLKIPGCLSGCAVCPPAVPNPQGSLPCQYRRTWGHSRKAVLMVQCHWISSCGSSHPESACAWNCRPGQGAAAGFPMHCIPIYVSMMQPFLIRCNGCSV